MSSSAGIYGPAVLSAPFELRSAAQLTPEFETLGRQLIPAEMEAVDDELRSLLACGNPRKVDNSDHKLRRLTAVPDKEGKMRVVAIFDYWSQYSLRPVHDAVGAVLRKLKQDCTYDQARFIKALGLSTIEDRDYMSPSMVEIRTTQQPFWPPTKSEVGDVNVIPFPRFSRAVLGDQNFYSVDLSSATDRWPIEVQIRVVERLLGKYRAAAWAKLMKHPLSVDRSIDHPGEAEVVYACGQPMGSYSSFPVFALSHHCVIRALAGRLRVTPTYAVLGDDVVIHGNQLGESYLQFLKQAGVPYSLHKTFISRASLEFAKRTIWRGYEVTPLSMAEILVSRDR